MRYGLAIFQAPLVCSLTTREQRRLVVRLSMREPKALGTFGFRVAQGVEGKGPASQQGLVAGGEPK
ncbi:MAG: hypothetical protein WBM47_17605, partial [Polyangiales bacterium]